MFHSADYWFCRLARRWLMVGVAFVGVALCASMPVSAQVVATYTFADGTADGWVSFNGASTPVASSAAEYSGSSYSLLTTTNSSGAGGPSVSLNGVLQAGAQYTITGWVQLTGGESAGNANFTSTRQRGHAGTTYGKLLARRCSATDGFNPEGTAVATTRDSIASGALSASVRPLRPVKLYIAGVPTT
jgi:hypothetical protein